MEAPDAASGPKRFQISDVFKELTDGSWCRKEGLGPVFGVVSKGEVLHHERASELPDRVKDVFSMAN